MFIFKVKLGNGLKKDRNICFWREISQTKSRFSQGNFFIKNYLRVIGSQSPKKLGALNSAFPKLGLNFYK